MNDLTQQVAELAQQVSSLFTRQIGKNDIIPGSVQPQHISGHAAIVVFDISTNRPKTGTNYCMAFFAIDTGVLSIWSSQAGAWKSVTLT